MNDFLKEVSERLDNTVIQSTSEHTLDDSNRALGTPLEDMLSMAQDVAEGKVPDKDDSLDVIIQKLTEMAKPADGIEEAEGGQDFLGSAGDRSYYISVTKGDDGLVEKLEVFDSVGEPVMELAKEEDAFDVIRSLYQIASEVSLDSVSFDLLKDLGVLEIEAEAEEEAPESAEEPGEEEEPIADEVEPEEAPAEVVEDSVKKGGGSIKEADGSATDYSVSDGETSKTYKADSEEDAKKAFFNDIMLDDLIMQGEIDGKRPAKDVEKLYHKYTKDLKVSDPSESKAVGGSIVDKIDWTGLEKKLSEVLGVKITLEVGLDEKGYITWTGKEDLVKDAGVYKNLLKYVNLISFCFDKEEKVLRKGRYWCKALLKAEGLYVGTTQVGILYATYYLDTKKWEFLVGAEMLSVLDQDPDEVVEDSVKKGGGSIKESAVTFISDLRAILRDMGYRKEGKMRFDITRGSGDIEEVTLYTEYDNSVDAKKEYDTLNDVLIDSDDIADSGFTISGGKLTGSPRGGSEGFFEFKKVAKESVKDSVVKVKEQEGTYKVVATYGDEKLAQDAVKNVEGGSVTKNKDDKFDIVVKEAVADDLEKKLKALKADLVGFRKAGDSDRVEDIEKEIAALEAKMSESVEVEEGKNTDPSNTDTEGIIKDLMEKHKVV